jgi:hypothetical protein
MQAFTIQGQNSGTSAEFRLDLSRKSSPALELRQQNKHSLGLLPRKRKLCLKFSTEGLFIYLFIGYIFIRLKNLHGICHKSDPVRTIGRFSPEDKLTCFLIQRLKLKPKASCV